MYECIEECLLNQLQTVALAYHRISQTLLLILLETVLAILKTGKFSFYSEMLTRFRVQVCHVSTCPSGTFLIVLHVHIYWCECIHFILKRIIRFNYVFCKFRIFYNMKFCIKKEKM